MNVDDWGWLELALRITAVVLVFGGVRSASSGRFIRGLVACGLGFLVGYSAGFVAGHMKHAEQAVEHGHAHYYLDENNERRWEWLPPCNMPPRRLGPAPGGGGSPLGASGALR